MGHTSEDATRHREAVFQRFSTSVDLLGTKATSMVKDAERVAAAKRFLNGNFEQKRKQHYCAGRNCCISVEDAKQQIEHLFINELMFLSPWCESRWLGIDDCCDFHGFWMCTYSVLPRVYATTFFPGETGALDNETQLDPAGVGIGDPDFGSIHVFPFWS